MNIIHFKRIVWRCALLFVLISLEQRDDFRALFDFKPKEEKNMIEKLKMTVSMTISAKQPNSIVPFIVLLILLFFHWFGVFIFSFQIFSPFCKFKNSKNKNMNREIEEKQTLTMEEMR